MYYVSVILIIGTDLYITRMRITCSGTFYSTCHCWYLSCVFGVFCQSVHESCLLEVTYAIAGALDNSR